MQHRHTHYGTHDNIYPPSSGFVY